jgi:glycosyltransferase involved in cell wall biosynthesis
MLGCYSANADTGIGFTLVAVGRFHHFHLARQLQKRSLLHAIYTGYPKFKLKDESGIPSDKVHTFAWLQAPFMAFSKKGLHRWDWLQREWSWQAHESLDRFVARQLNTPTILVALSGSGLYCGRLAKKIGGLHICDRGSSHIRIQEELLREEYRRYGVQWKGIDPRMLSKQEAEYEQADRISVPSQFCFDSFVEQGVPPSKLIKIPYGAHLERFWASRSMEVSNEEEFRVLFVGHAGPRKGFIDLVTSFMLFEHPRKRLVLIGSLSSEALQVIEENNLDFVETLGAIPNNELQKYYTSSTVLVLPSIEEGLAMVVGEAMACGCPVIATLNTGAADLISDGIEGFIVPIRSPEIIAERLQKLADEPDLRNRMSVAAHTRVQNLVGWETYGNDWQQLAYSLSELL